MERKGRGFKSLGTQQSRDLWYRLDLMKDAEAAISGPVDFSQLFLSFGLFVVLAGLSLSALLLDSRWSKETGRLVCCFLWDTPQGE